MGTETVLYDAISKLVGISDGVHCRRTLQTLVRVLTSVRNQPNDAQLHRISKSADIFCSDPSSEAVLSVLSECGFEEGVNEWFMRGISLAKLEIVIEILQTCVLS